MMKLFSAFLILLGMGAPAGATTTKSVDQVNAELKTIATITPAGFELAMTYGLSATPSESEIKSLADSYVFFDFNGDGIADLAVAYEQIPTYETEKYSDGTTYQQIVHGSRQLAIYFGQKDGSYKLAATNANILSHADEGGAVDPFGDLEISKLGSLEVTEDVGRGAYHSGSTIKIQYRQQNGQAGFYAVGSTHDDDDRFANVHKTVDTNFLTGMQLTTVTTYTADNGRVKSVVKTTKNLGRKALVPMSLIANPWN